MELLALVKEAWGWTGLDPDQIVGDNDFGNLMVRDTSGRYWRICPEDLTCAVVADTREELQRLASNQEFLHDWYMREMVRSANERLGPLRAGYKYYLIIPGALGGEYGGTNVAAAPHHEIISAFGEIAQHISGLPDGSKIRLSVTD